MKRLAILVSMVTLCGVAAAAHSADPAGQRSGPIFVTIGTGPVTGNYYRAGRYICRLLNEAAEDPKILCSVERTTGSIHNLKAVEAGITEFGLCQSDHLMAAYGGKGLFKEPLPHLRRVARLFREYLHVVVRADGNVRDVSDLRGKRVSIGVKGSGGHASAILLLRSLGIGENHITKTDDISNARALSLLCSGEMDAVVFVAGLPYGPLTEAAHQCPLRLVELNRDHFQTLMSSNGAWWPGTIPAQTYSGQAEPVHTVSVWATLVTSSKVHDDIVCRVTRILLQNGGKHEGQGLEPSKSLLPDSEPDHEKGRVPVHPGAAVCARPALDGDASGAERTTNR